MKTIMTCSILAVFAVEALTSFAQPVQEIRKLGTAKAKKFPKNESVKMVSVVALEVSNVS